MYNITSGSGENGETYSGLSLCDQYRKIVDCSSNPMKNIYSLLMLVSVYACVCVWDVSRVCAYVWVCVCLGMCVGVRVFTHTYIDMRTGEI